MGISLAHHDHSDPNFRAHVLYIGDNAICIGCTASKIFMHSVLPMLLLAFGYLRFDNLLEFGLLGLFLMSSFLSARETIKGSIHPNKWINSIPGLFQIISLTYVASLTTSIPLSQRLIYAFMLSMPQISLYTWKIIMSKEYFNTKIKLITRLLMIMGLFFATIDLFSTPLVSGSFIILSGIVFVKFRRFSGFRAGNDKIPVMHSIGSLTARLENKIGLTSDRIVTSNQTFLVFVLFLLGLISLVSNGSTSSCDSSIEAATISFVPIIAMSKSNFCPNCGDPVGEQEKFCDKCGLNLDKPYEQTDTTPVATPQQKPSGYADNQYPRKAEPIRRSTSQSTNYGGTNYQGARNADQGCGAGSGAALAGAIIVLLFGWLITGSFGIGLLAGVIAFGGIALFNSTNDPCAKYLIADCCCDCVCSLLSESGNSGGRRR